MKTALITGVSGFAGSFLAEYLVSLEDIKVIGIYNSGKNLVSLDSIKEKIVLEQIDLLEKDKLKKYLESNKPDYVFHLAGLASPSASYKDPKHTITTNVLSQLSLLEALKELSFFDTKVLIVSSAEVYGSVQEKDLPISESFPLKPISPYAVSKISQEFLAMQYMYSYGFNIIISRSFNHIGPRQSSDYVVSSFAKQISLIEKSLQEPLIRVGNLSAKRDFTDVRDIVRAYFLLLEKGVSGEIYNVGSGKSFLIEDILKKLLSFSNIDIKIEVDQDKFRKVDIVDNCSDPSRLVQDTGWDMRCSIDNSLQDTLDYWRNIV